MIPCPPVLLIVFRRPDTTRQVFEAIRAARPSRLFLAADGPRAHRVGEDLACAETRKVVEQIDWPCEVQTRFRTENVGAGRNVAEAITWFLDACGEGIILEDDCLPHPDFFRYCAETLELYRNDSRIMHVSGSNFRKGRRTVSDSYTFSRYNHGWGWATWQRAWSLFDPRMERLESFLVAAQETQFWDSPKERRYWTKVFRQAQRGEMDAWDFQWKLSMWMAGGLCLYPEVNLISNLGFGDKATNTVDSQSHKGNRALEAVGPMVHPQFILRHRPADQEGFLTMYWGSPLERFATRIRKLRLLLAGRS